MGEEYSEGVTVTHDDDYYAALCRDELVGVADVPGKGKGLVAEVAFREGDTVLTENALACIQNLDERREKLPVCAHTLRSLETPEEVFQRVLKKPPGDLPGIAAPLASGETFECAAPVPCQHSATGCPLAYTCEDVRDKAWAEHHCVLCKGQMSPEQREAYEEFEREDWVQGGVDYSDTFHLSLHILCLALASVRKGVPPEEAWRPYSMLISCPWQRFTFHYLLSSEGDSEEGRTKEETLSKAMRLLHTMFGTTEDDPIVNEHRFTRLLGAVLLNGQERAPQSPWVEYLEWLNRPEERKTRKRVRKLAEKDERVKTAARGQGVYRIGACFNHSCYPNVQVSYNTENDETLVVFATRPIAKGEELCISYIDESADVKERRSQLSDHYLFDCTCPACKRELQAQP